MWVGIYKCELEAVPRDSPRSFLPFSFLCFFLHVLLMTLATKPIGIKKCAAQNII